MNHGSQTQVKEMPGSRSGHLPGRRLSFLSCLFLTAPLTQLESSEKGVQLKDGIAQIALACGGLS